MSNQQFSKNGFTCPLHCAQIASWIIISSNIIMFYCIHVPLSPSVTVTIIRHTFCVIYGVSILIIIVSTLFCTISIPSDPTLFLSKEEQEKKLFYSEEKGMKKDLNFVIFVIHL